MLEKQLDEIPGENEEKRQSHYEIDGPDRGPESQIRDELRVADGSRVQKENGCQHQERGEGEKRSRPVDPPESFEPLHDAGQGSESAPGNACQVSRIFGIVASSQA